MDPYKAMVKIQSAGEVLKHLDLGATIGGYEAIVLHSLQSELVNSIGRRPPVVAWS